MVDLRSCFHGKIFAVVAVAAAANRIHSLDTATGADNLGGVVVVAAEGEEAVAEEEELADDKAGVGSGTLVVVAAAAVERVHGKTDVGFGSFVAVAGGLCDDDQAADTGQLRIHCSIVTAVAERPADLRT